MTPALDEFFGFAQHMAGQPARPAGDVLREAEKLVERGRQELLVISQDTSAYGVDIK